jgi:hypothetical protein
MRSLAAILGLAAGCAAPPAIEPRPEPPPAPPPARSEVPLRAIDGKVTGYAPRAAILAINQGRDHGVRVGMKFTIYRGREFVATAVVREVDRDWSAASLELKHLEPRTGDDASNHIR